MKNLIKKITKNFEFKKGDDFDFQAHLLNDDFVLRRADENFQLHPEHLKTYAHKEMEIKLTIDFSNKTVSVYYKNDLISLLNFIPSGELFANMFLAYIVLNLKKVD